MPTIITAGALAAKGYGFGSAASTGPAVYVEDVFSTYLYTGNGSSQTITNGIDLSTKGGLVWLKSRVTLSSPYTGLEFNCLFDNVRTGATGGAAGGGGRLRTDSTQSAQSSTYLNSYNTDGFTITSSSTVAAADIINQSGKSFCAWTFRKQAKFFDVVTYTGTGSARTISHALGSTPGMIIVKRTDAADDWQVYHRSLTSAANSIQLNLTAAQASATTVWNSTAPTSSVFSVGTDATVNASGGTYVAYLFAHDAGGFGASGTDSVVTCSSAGGGGSLVNIGWEPQYVLMKYISGTPTGGVLDGWLIFDVMRGAATGFTANGAQRLLANTNDAETSMLGIDINSTGFRTPVATSGDQTFIYMAIRRGPMKTPTDATKVFEPQTQTLGNSFLYSIGGFGGTPMDMVLYKSQTTADNRLITKLIGNGKYLNTTSSAAEITGQTNPRWSTETPTNYPGTVIVSGDSSSYAIYKFRRAPGFFDVISWTGSGVAQSFPHNLGVAPQLLIYKARDNTTPWVVGYADSGSPVSTTLYLNGPETNLGFAFAWFGGITPTATIAPIGTNSSVSTPGVSYIGYLFATCPGVSKVGSYTGTSAAQNIDCGFSAAARFVLIKRTSATGDWFVYDTARGMSAGNDPYLLINSTAAEVTGTNYVDTFATGFALTAAAPNQLNGSGHTFIFLAIA